MTSSDFEWLGTLRLAKQFLKSAIILQEHSNDPELLPDSVYFLYHHAAELSLKSFLLTTGETSKSVKKLGHSIGVVLKKCITNGYSPSDDVRKYLLCIGEGGGQVNTRYFRQGLATRTQGSSIRILAIEFFEDIAGENFENANYPMRIGFLDDLQDRQLS